MMSNKFDKFTKPARRVLTYAQEEAMRFNHNYIGTEHLLLGLVREAEGLASKVLRELGADQDRVRQVIEEVVGRGQAAPGTRFSLSPRIKRAIELAAEEARQMQTHYIDTEHLLLGIIGVGDGIAISILKGLGIRPAQVRATLEQQLKYLSEIESESEDVPRPGTVLILNVADESLKDSLVHLIEKLGLRPVVVQDGMAISWNVRIRYAILLLTLEGLVAWAQAHGVDESRAREDIAFELGRLLGRLGDHRVCVLYRPGVEHLFGYGGVSYLPMDPGDVWEHALANGIKDAGIDIDPNSAA